MHLIMKYYSQIRKQALSEIVIWSQIEIRMLVDSQSGDITKSNMRLLVPHIKPYHRITICNSAYKAPQPSTPNVHISHLHITARGKYRRQHAQ